MSPHSKKKDDKNSPQGRGSIAGYEKLGSAIFAEVFLELSAHDIFILNKYDILGMALFTNVFLCDFVLVFFTFAHFYFLEKAGGMSIEIHQKKNKTIHG